MSYLPHLALENSTCFQLKRPTISKSFICLFYKVQGTIIEKSWGWGGAVATYICVLRNNLLNIRINIYEFFVVACLFV